MKDDLYEFISNFSLSNNLLMQRTLNRWNGRDLNRTENLAEHSSLVVAVLLELCEKYVNAFNLNVDYKRIVKYALTHDSLELLRGDILSITKDVHPKIREIITEEENEFQSRINQGITKDERELVNLADLKACYMFIEWELRNPNNNFVKEVYLITKRKYETELSRFKFRHGVIDYDTPYEGESFCKGYKDDAGVDIILDKDIVFLPLSTTNFELNCTITPKEGKVAFLFSRTSAAAKGLVVSSCPIDPNYSGKLSAIVHNISNDIITYNRGESFCQVVMMNADIRTDLPVKREGKRSTSKLGGTGI